MDWATQPDKFRRLLGAPSLDLPRSGPGASVPASASPQRLLALPALGALLHDAAGITAWKRQVFASDHSVCSSAST